MIYYNPSLCFDLIKYWNTSQSVKIRCLSIHKTLERTPIKMANTDKVSKFWS